MLPISGSNSSIETILCKKWEVDYVLIGQIKIERLAGATEINYEFSKDQAFVMMSSDPDDKTKETWSYNPAKKLSG